MNSLCLMTVLQPNGISSRFQSWTRSASASQRLIESPLRTSSDRHVVQVINAAPEMDYLTLGHLAAASAANTCLQWIVAPNFACLGLRMACSSQMAPVTLAYSSIYLWKCIIIAIVVYYTEMWNAQHTKTLNVVHHSDWWEWLQRRTHWMHEKNLWLWLKHVETLFVNSAFV